MAAHDVHAMRRLVTAMDKNLAVQKPLAEAVKYISERYKTDVGSATDYVMYLRGLQTPGGVSTKSNPVDVRHTCFDQASGRWVELSEEEAEA